MDVLDRLLLSHPDVAGSRGHLELDGSLQVGDLGLQVVSVGDHGTC